MVYYWSNVYYYFLPNYCIISFHKSQVSDITWKIRNAEIAMFSDKCTWNIETCQNYTPRHNYHDCISNSGHARYLSICTILIRSTTTLWIWLTMAKCIWRESKSWEYCAIFLSGLWELDSLSWPYRLPIFFVSAANSFIILVTCIKFFLLCTVCIIRTLCTARGVTGIQWNQACVCKSYKADYINGCTQYVLYINIKTAYSTDSLSLFYGRLYLAFSWSFYLQ